MAYDHMLRNLYQTVMHPGTHFRQKVLSSMVWVYGLQMSTQTLQMIRTFILARWLDPEAFGRIGIVMMVFAALNVLSETGFDRALIQKKEMNRGHLDTAWSLTILRGLLRAMVLIAVAPLIADFYDSPRVGLLIRVIALGSVFSGFINIGVVYLPRDIQFKQNTLYQFGAAVAGFVMTVGAAYVLRNALAVVIGLVAQTAAACLLSYRVHPFRPRWGIDWGKARELYSFGFWIFAFSIAVYLTQQYDKMVVPKLLTVEMLGYYVMAFTIARFPASMTGVVSRVLYPVFCRVQDDSARLQKSFSLIMQALPVIALPLCLGLAVGAEPLIRVLGAKWLPAVPVLRLLVLSTMVRTLTSPFGSMLNARGKPKLSFFIVLVRVLVMMLLIPPLTVHAGWGMKGTAAAVLISSLTSLPFILHYCKQQAGFRYGDWLSAIAGPALAALVMVGAGGAALYWGPVGVWPRFLTMGLAMAVTYVGAMYVIHRLRPLPVFDYLQQILFTRSEGSGLETDDV